jgi:hypothetical protein
MKFVNLAALAVIGLMLATAFSGCVGGEKTASTSNETETTTTDTSAAAGSNTTSGSNNETIVDDSAEKEVQPIIETVTLTIGYVAGFYSPLPDVPDSPVPTSGMIILQNADYGPQTFTIKSNCTGIIAKVEGSAKLPTATTFAFQIRGSDDAWEATGESLPLEVRVPGKNLTECEDGTEFKAAIFIKDADVVGEYTVKIDMYYLAPPPDMPGQ